MKLFSNSVLVLIIIYMWCAVAYNIKVDYFEEQLVQDNVNRKKYGSEGNETNKLISDFSIDKK